MNSESLESHSVRYVSIGIFAWNEQDVIRATLSSLLEQTLLEELPARGLNCELICVLNGCTDNTAQVASAFLQDHPLPAGFSWRVINLPERGKLNAWNQFVHTISAPQAQFLFMMDADILLTRRGTLNSMLRTLESDPHASIATDAPMKDVAYKPRKSFADRLSLAAAQITRSSPAQLCAQLYCIKADVARNIYLPRDLAACEDGFIKTVVCTDFLTHESYPERIRLAPDAEHTFEAYTSPRAVLKNQKRQHMGQTIVHILVDKYLKHLPLSQREHLADTLRIKDAEDPSWLKRLINQHLAATNAFWKLYPGLLSHRFRRLAGLSPLQRLLCLPTVLVGLFVTSASSLLAYRSLKAGCTNYWPRAERARQSDTLSAFTAKS
jgi:glycosyltransferase involved in cell wall biosynthesis